MSDPQRSGVLPRPLSAVSTERSLPRLAVNQVTTARWTLAQDVMGWQEVGIPAIGLVRRKLEVPSATAGLAALFDSRVEVSSLSWIEGFTGADSRTHDESIADGIEAVRLASLVGARTLVVDSGARGGHIGSHARRLVEEGLLAVADDAAQRGVRLAVRPLHPVAGAGRTFLATVNEAIDLVDDCDHAAIGLAVDARQLWFERDLLQRVREWAPLTHLVQLADWRGVPQPGQDGLLPGEGRLPLGALVERVHAAGYAGDFEVSIESTVQWSRNYVELLMDVKSRFAELTDAIVVEAASE